MEETSTNRLGSAFKLFDDNIGLMARAFVVIESEDMSLIEREKMTTLLYNAAIAVDNVNSLALDILDRYEKEGHSLVKRVESRANSNKFREALVKGVCGKDANMAKSIIYNQNEIIKP